MTAASDLETELTRRAWTDGTFARLLSTDPVAALARLGITVPAGVRLDVRIQQPDTLYYMIPPEAHDDGDHVVVNQMDLWRSGDVFVWLAPEAAKLALLDLRRQYRAARADGTDAS